MSRLRQQLLHEDSLKTLSLSLTSLRKAAVHPYVLDKLKKWVKPVLGVAATVYFIGLVLLIPLQLIGFLVELGSLGRIAHSSVTELGKHWLHDTLSLIPLLALLLMRNFVRKPLFKSFIHMLRDVNPGAAAALEQDAVKHRDDPGSRRKSRTFQKVALLMGFELSLAIARKLPLLGWPAVVLTNFLTMKAALGRDRAIVLSLLGLVPYLDRWVLQFVQLWRSSIVLGQELISYYTQAVVPPSQRAAFYKAHDVDIPLFALPGTLLLQVPVVGPLLFIPIQAAAAFLVDKLAKEGQPLGGGSATEMQPLVPTRPPELVQRPPPPPLKGPQPKPTLPASPHPHLGS